MIILTIVKQKPDYDHEDTLKIYEELISRFPSVERKGKTMPYTSVNGHMFSFLDKEGKLSIRLSDSNRTAFMTKYNAALSVQHGRVMKEYVVVPDSLLQNLKELQPYFGSSYSYTSALKPKPTKKK